MPVTELNHAFVRATDLERSRRFSTDVLGFAVLPRKDFPFSGDWLGVGAKVQVHMGPSGIPKSQLYDPGTKPACATHDSGVVDDIAFLATEPEHFAARFASLGSAARHRHPQAFKLFQMFIEEPDGLTIEPNFHGVEDASLWRRAAKSHAALPRAGDPWAWAAVGPDSLPTAGITHATQEPLA